MGFPALLQESQNAGMLGNEAGAEVSRDANGSGGPPGAGRQGKGAGWTGVQLALSKAARHLHAASASLFKPQKDPRGSPAQPQLCNPKLGWMVSQLGGEAQGCVQLRCELSRGREPTGSPGGTIPIAKVFPVCCVLQLPTSAGFAAVCRCPVLGSPGWTLCPVAVSEASSCS